MTTTEFVETIRKSAAGVTHHAVAVTLLGASAGAIAFLSVLFGGCTPELKSDVAAGEAYLFASNLGQAEDIADDALVSGPRCGCALALKADVERQRMIDALATGDAVGADHDRALCYKLAEHAWALHERSPRVVALIKTCKTKVTQA